MSYLLTGIIAIVLTTFALIAGVSVYDARSLDSTALAKTVESKLSQGSEAIANYSAGTGTRPESVSDLVPMGLPQVDGGTGQGIDGGKWALTCGPSGCQRGLTLCIEMPNSATARSSADSVAAKMHAVVSGTCGAADAPGSQISVGVTL